MPFKQIWLKQGLVCSAFLLLAGPSAGANWHDHLFLLPRARDLEAALGTAQNPPLAQALAKLPRAQQRIRALLVLNAGMAPEQVEAAGLADLERWRILDWLNALREGHGVPIDRILSFAALADPAANRDVYLAIFELRKTIYLSSSTAAIARAFESYLRSEAPEHRDVILCTASPSAFADEQIEKLRAIRTVARSLGSDFRHFMVVQRLEWAAGESRWPARWRELARQDVVHGIDLSGSLEEAETAEALERIGHRALHLRFVELARLARSAGLPLRVHAFEHMNQGAFYAAIRTGLDEVSKDDISGASSDGQPLRVMIAHFAQLTRPWISFLAQLPPARIQVFLQSTPASYAVLVDRMNWRLLAEHEAFARGRGLSIQYGFDGRGVFEAVWPGPPEPARSTRPSPETRRPFTGAPACGGAVRHEPGPAPVPSARAK